MTTQKHIRGLVKSGAAVDGNKLTYAQVCELRNHRVKIDTSAGVYGVNGAVVLDSRDCTLYGFVGRTTNLWVIC